MPDPVMIQIPAPLVQAMVNVLNKLPYAQVAPVLDALKPYLPAPKPLKEVISKDN